MRNLFAALFGLALLCSPVAADVLTLQQGTASYTGMKDNVMDNESSGWNNRGTCGYCWTGNVGSILRRCLMEWDVSGVPAGATITAVTLSVNTWDDANRTQNDTVNVFTVAEANEGWSEGGSCGAPDNDDACWAYKAYNYSNWAGSAGLSTSGTDYDSTAAATETVNDGTSGWVDFDFTAAGVADMQTAVDGDDVIGFVLIGSGTAGTLTPFPSSEDATVEDRPKLVITYTPAGGGRRVISVN